MGNNQNKAQNAWEKFEEKNGGSFGLGRKGLGSDTDTETRS